MRPFQFSRWTKFAAVAAAVACISTEGVIRLARGSDHQDTPDVELNPASDMTDVYAFPGSSPDRIVLVLNSWAFITPAQTTNSYFDPDLLTSSRSTTTPTAAKTESSRSPSREAAPIRRSRYEDRLPLRSRARWGTRWRRWRLR